MVANSWFRSLWATSKKHEFHAEKAKIAVLAFEAASLMTKLLNLWQSLTDKQVTRLREEITNSKGIKNLVSDDDEYISKLMCAEFTENLAHVACSVSRLSKKCNDPLVKSFEQAFSDLIKIGVDTYGWQFTWKKMDRKAKKMEKFIVTNTRLYQEMETLADLEQTLKRMRCNDNVDSIMLVEYEKKIAWKKQEVKHFKENSLWNRTYDYTILLLARSLFTIYGRIGHVFGINQVADVAVNDSRVFTDILNNRRNHSTVFMQSSVYPSDNYLPRFFSGSSGKSISASGPLLRTNDTSNFHLGLIGCSRTTTSSPVSGKYKGVGSHSGPLGMMPTAKSGPISRTSKSTFKLWHFRDKSQNAEEKDLHHHKSNEPTISGTLTSNSSDVYSDIRRINGSPNHGSLLVVGGKTKLLDAPQETLGAAALALHYANVIILIEKLVASPHLIGNDARNDLYNMLPASIRSALRAKLKPYAKMNSSIYDTELAGEWNEAMSKTLEWLAPLAHNMIRWQTERSIEHQNLVSRTHVLLVQTLYFANQEKTEDAITDLLVGLNYIWRFGREINAKCIAECASGRTLDEYLE